VIFAVLAAALTAGVSVTFLAPFFMIGPGRVLSLLTALGAAAGVFFAQV